MSDYYPPNTRVLVVLPHYEYTGQVGTVTATYNDGATWCTGSVSAPTITVFCHSAYYEAEELRDVTDWRNRDRKR